MKSETERRLAVAGATVEYNSSKILLNRM